MERQASDYSATQWNGPELKVHWPYMYINKCPSSEIIILSVFPMCDLLFSYSVQLFGWCPHCPQFCQEMLLTRQDQSLGHPGVLIHWDTATCQVPDTDLSLFLFWSSLSPRTTSSRIWPCLTTAHCRVYVEECVQYSLCDKPAKNKRPISMKCILKTWHDMERFCYLPKYGQMAASGQQCHIHTFFWQNKAALWLSEEVNSKDNVYEVNTAIPVVWQQLDNTKTRTGRCLA